MAPEELKLQRVMSCLKWGMKTKFRSSGQAASSPVKPSPQPQYYYYFTKSMKLLSAAFSLKATLKKQRSNYCMSSCLKSVWKMDVVAPICNPAHGSPR